MRIRLGDNPPPERPVHSSAPWLIDQWQNPILIRSDNGDIVHEQPLGMIWCAEVQANACLIVAAPDMLYALKDIVHDLESFGVPDEHLRDAQAAIHRATYPSAPIPPRRY